MHAINNLLPPLATQPPAATPYVDAPKLLETLFPEKSLRWLRSHQRELPNVRLGRLIMFDPVMVKAHLDAKGKGREMKSFLPQKIRQRINSPQGLSRLSAPDFTKPNARWRQIAAANFQKGWIMAGEISLDPARLEM